MLHLGKHSRPAWRGNLEPGKLTITQSTIHNNTVNGEPDDIVNEYSGQLALMDDYDALVALYATYGLIPN